MAPVSAIALAWVAWVHKLHTRQPFLPFRPFRLIVAMASCYGIMLWHHVMASCYGIMLWHHAMASCYGIMLWHHAMASCYGIAPKPFTQLVSHGLATHHLAPATRLYRLYILYTSIYSIDRTPNEKPQAYLRQCSQCSHTCSTIVFRCRITTNVLRSWEF